MKKTLLLLATALLTAVSSFAETATLVTSTSDLNETSEYVLACPDASYSVAMSGTNAGTYFIPTAKVTFTGTSFTIPADAGIIKLEKSGTNWKLKIGTYYIYCPKTRSAKLGTPGSDDVVDATISFSGNNVKITYGSNGALFYNHNGGTNPRFMNYTSTSMTPISLYKVGEGGGETPALSVAAPTFTPATGTKLYADDKVTIACETEGAEITYTVNGSESQAYHAEGISFSKNGTYTIKATATLTKDDETATANAEATYTYAVERPKEIHAVQVTSTDNILEGAEYVLALNDKAMGNTLGGTSSKPYIPTTAATYADDALIVDREKHAIINFEPAESGKWYLKVSNFGETGGYVKSAISAGNNCTIGTDPEHAAEVTFTTVSGEVRAQIHYVTDGTDSYLAANNSANRYSCYTSYDDNGSKARPALYALPAEDMSFSVVGPDGAEVSSTIDIENYKNEATGNYYNITVSYPKGTALYYRTTSYHMMVNGVDVLKPIVVDDKEIIPVLGEFKLAPKAEAAAAAASVAAESGMNTAVIGLASKGDFELRLQDAAGNVSEGKSYKINGNATGVEDIAVDGVEDGEAVYYNMQGVRVANPAAGNLYIRVQGSKAAKVLVK